MAPLKTEMGYVNRVEMYVVCALSIVFCLTTAWNMDESILDFVNNHMDYHARERIENLEEQVNLLIGEEFEEDDQN